MASPELKTEMRADEIERLAGRVEYQVSRRIDALATNVDKLDMRLEAHRERTDEKLDNILDAVADIRADLRADEAVAKVDDKRREAKRRVREFVIATASFVALSCSVAVPLLIH